MMVVPAPRAIPPLSLSESRPKTVRVESGTANTKPATANTPTITGREYLSCLGIGVLLFYRWERYSPPPTGGVQSDCSGFTNAVEKIKPCHPERSHCKAMTESKSPP